SPTRPEDRRTRARPPARDGGRRRALPGASRGPGQATDPRRRNRERSYRARPRTGEVGRARHWPRRIVRRARAGEGERRADGYPHRAPSARPFLRSARWALGCRRLEPALRPTRRDRRAPTRGRGVGASAGGGGGGRACVTSPEVEAAITALRAGGLAVIPTDTVYGLACDPERVESVARLSEAKGRTSDQPIALVAASLAALLGCLPELRGRDEAVARELRPGPYTLVFRNTARRYPLLTGSRP